MSQTYKVTGINLKGVPFGEQDRLLTILTPEWGLLRAVAGGARKHHSRLRGRSELFVVNELLLVKGRSSLYRLTQAETIDTYSKLSQNLAKLAISQYLSEIVLAFALSEQPQPELFTLFREHLHRIENCSIVSFDQEKTIQALFSFLNQGIFHLLSLAGIAPQLYQCCLTQSSFNTEEGDPHGHIGFSYQAGGIVSQQQATINDQLNSTELRLLQTLSQPTFCPPMGDINDLQTIEKLLRHYTEYHLNRSIRSATLVDTLLTSNATIATSL